MASVIKSKRRCEMLVDELQYMYHKHSENKSGTIIYWECSQKKKKQSKVAHEGINRKC